MSEMSPEKLISEVEEYFKVSYEIKKLELSSKLSESGALIASAQVTFTSFVVAVFFLSLALGYYLSDLFGSYPLGFLLIGCIYFLVFLLLFTFKKRLLKVPLKNWIIKMLLKKSSKSYE